MTEELSREALYEKVWTTPMKTLAAELGISDVALAKRCRKLQVPCPGRGYWVKVEHGKPVIRVKLPEVIAEAEEPQVPVSAHHRKWPREIEGLTERAQLLRTELLKAKPNYRGMQSTENPALPKVQVKKDRIEEVARLFHALLFAIEAKGIPFRKFRGKIYGGYFEKGDERLYLEIEEEVEGDRFSPRPQDEKKPGALRITLWNNHYARNWRKSWTVEKNGSMRNVVGQVVKDLNEHYVKKAREAAEEEEKRQIAHEKWLVDEEIRKKENHAKALVETGKARIQDLFRAAEWRRVYGAVVDFAGECEERWKAEGSLSPEQEEWLAWAREAADGISPWREGYPDPARDGRFKDDAVAFGGPYPAIRTFPRPPTIAPEPVKESGSSWGNSWPNRGY